MNARALWIIAIVLTLASAVYQRTTGPTYPRRVSAELGGTRLKAKLLRSHSVSGDLEVRVRDAAPTTGGAVRWRRFPLDEPWTETPLVRDSDGDLIAALPAQPSAGKLEYVVHLVDGDDARVLSGESAVVARFKGDVPAFILIPHVLFMFLGMLWSNRAGLEALAGGPKLKPQGRTTLILLALGGFLLGPIVQKYAFGAYWTGWPLGEDLTDNKLAAAVLAWLVAVIWNHGRRGRVLAVIAALVVLGVYMIPHSMNGSTLDYATMQTVTG